jgi:hypothetical protein
MIVLDRPQITDLFIPRTGCADAAIKKGCFNRKDIMTILSNYITVESATTILDEIFVDYISGDNNLTELILNAVGDVYTREQIDEIVDSIQEQIDGMGFATEQWVEDQGYIDDITLTINGQEVHNGDSITVPAAPPAMFIYVDDFPDGVSEGSTCYDPETGEEIPCPYTERYCDEWMETFYAKSNLDEYLDWYLTTDEETQVNTYVYTGEFEYDGEEYWMYMYSAAWGDGGEVKYGLLPKTVTREELQNNSLETDHQNIFNDYEPFAYFLRYDGKVYERVQQSPNILVAFK